MMENCLIPVLEHINSSLNGPLQILLLLGLCKILYSSTCYHFGFRSCRPMRPTKCGQDQANRTLRSQARAKNEGIFGVFECDI